MNLTDIVNQAHVCAVRQGFWGDNRTLAEAIALIHSEASEALEVIRNREGDARLGEELADIIIRVADMAGAVGIDLEDAVRVKMARNETRPYKHGKRF